MKKNIAQNEKLYILIDRFGMKSVDKEIKNKIEINSITLILSEHTVTLLLF